MYRQERVGSSLQDPETIRLSVRRKPRGVRLVWVEGSQQGREVLWSPVETGGQIHVKMPSALVPRLTLAPDNPMIARSSRHPISEAGFDAVLDNFEEALIPYEADTSAPGSLEYRGIEPAGRPARPCHKVIERRSNGETWTVCLDAQSLMPAAVIGFAADGSLLERYEFSSTEADPATLASADAFNPDALWGPARGLFGRRSR